MTLQRIRRWAVLWMCGLCALPISVAGADEVTEAIQAAEHASRDAVAVIECQLRPRRAGEGPRSVRALGVCLDADGGVFVTLGLPAGLSDAVLQSVTLTGAGPGGRTVKGAFMGTDPGTGLSFVQAAEQADWRALKFASSANLSLGQRITSVGTVGSDAANTRRYGVAYVSSQLRLPDHLVLVTGGRLTSIGSPVLDASGKVVGLVGRQLYETYQLAGRGGAQQTPLRSLGSAQYFMPVDEFVHVFRRIPRGGQARRMGWIGCGFRSIPDEINMLGQPAVKVQNVIEGQPAAEAGLRNEDILLAIDGEKLEKLATPTLVRANVTHQLSKVPVGEQVTLTIRRDGQNRQIPVTVEAMPTTAQEARRFLSNRLGMVLREKVLLDEHLGDPHLAELEGMIVERVVRNGPAHEAGLQPGELITHVGPVPATGADKVQQALQQIPPDQPVKLVVRRDDQNVIVTVQPRGGNEGE